jgi:hypothetical protein
LPVSGPAIVEVVVVSVLPSLAFSDYLAHRAREGLLQILKQFRVFPKEANATDDLFQFGTSKFTQTRQGVSRLGHDWVFNHVLLAFSDTCRPKIRSADGDYFASRVGHLQ